MAVAHSYAGRFRIEPLDGEGAPGLRMRTGDEHEGRPGYLHGGVLAGLLEAAAGRCARSAAGGGAQPALITMTIDFRKGGRMEDVFAEAQIASRSRRLMIVDARAWQADRDTPIATAHCHFLLDGV